jgi:hypothetical protein
MWFGFIKAEKNIKLTYLAWISLFIFIIIFKLLGSFEPFDKFKILRKRVQSLNDGK